MTFGWLELDDERAILLGFADIGEKDVRPVLRFFAALRMTERIDKPETIDSDTWWEMLWITEWQEKLNDLLEDFGRQHEWQWQAGINGRSGGYVALYKRGIKPSGYKSYCTHCGQKNYQSVT